MSDSNLKTAVDTVKGLVEAVPVYQDALQPAAKEVGKALQTLTKTIHIVLAPVAGLVWGYEKISTYLVLALEHRLKHTPPERLTTPPPNVAGPILESLRFAGSNEQLRDLYANLLATSMDRESAKLAHPAFVEIIKQLSPDEARILKHWLTFLSTGDGRPTISFYVRMGKKTMHVIRHYSSVADDAKCECPELIGNYIDNLCRLGLTEIVNERTGSDADYKLLESKPLVKALRKAFKSFCDEHEGATLLAVRQSLQLTDLGVQFLDACVADHAQSRTTIPVLLAHFAERFERRSSKKNLPPVKP